MRSLSLPLLLSASLLHEGSCFVVPTNPIKPASRSSQTGLYAWANRNAPSSEPAAAQWESTASPLKIFVSALTDGLNAVVGLTGGSRAVRSSAASSAPLPPISPDTLLRKVQQDYRDRTYFLTGDISDECYDADCVFTDPTISFTGLDTWKRNLGSLTLFVEDPSITLYEARLDRAAKTITTKWELSCGLKLPWKPVLQVKGGTVHRYDPSRGGRIVSHVETWEVSAAEALGQMFKPGGKKQSGSAAANSVAKAGRVARALLPVGLGLLAPISGAVVDGARSGMVAVADDGKRVVGEIAASGLIFKDTINIEAFKDPKVQGVTLYVSDFQRPLTERLTKDFFSDPSQASVACVRTGPVKFDKIDMSKSGEEVFSEARSLLFKTIRVRRIYDKEANALIYVSYSTRLDKGDDSNKSRFKSSLCALPLYEGEFSPASP